MYSKDNKGDINIMNNLETKMIEFNKAVNKKINSLWTEAKEIDNPREYSIGILDEFRIMADFLDDKIDDHDYKDVTDFNNHQITKYIGNPFEFLDDFNGNEWLNINDYDDLDSFIDTLIING